MIHKTPRLFLSSCPGDVGYIPINVSIFGGYPSVMAFWAFVKDANTKKLIAEEKPLVHKLGNPRDPDLKKMGGVYHLFNSNANPVDDVVKDGDILQHYCNDNAGGYGDPIERDVGLIKKDLDNGLLSLEICRNVYCAVACFDPQKDEYVIDEKATKKIREQERKQRLERAIPVRQWWQKSRQKMLAGELPPLIKGMYNDSLAKGKRWTTEFKTFWNLADDFTL
jgi:hypothetical protein